MVSRQTARPSAPQSSIAAPNVKRQAKAPTKGPAHKIFAQTRSQAVLAFNFVPRHAPLALFGLPIPCVGLPPSHHRLVSAYQLWHCHRMRPTLSRELRSRLVKPRPTAESALEQRPLGATAPAAKLAHLTRGTSL